MLLGRVWEGNIYCINIKYDVYGPRLQDLSMLQTTATHALYYLTIMTYIHRGPFSSINLMVILSSQASARCSKVYLILI